MVHSRTSWTLFFGALCAVAACPFAGTTGAQPAPVEQGATTYRLIGTVAGADFAGAVFDDPAGGQSFSRLYDKLPDGSQIIKIYDDRIALKYPDGTVVELYTVHDAKGAASASSPVSTDRSWQAPAAADNRQQDERPKNVIRSAISQGISGTADGKNRTSRIRRHRASGENIGAQGAGPGARNRSREQ